MKYVKTYENFESDDIDYFDYVTAIKEIIENALTVGDVRPYWFADSIGLQGEDVIRFDSDEIQNRYKDEIYCEIDELHSDSVRVLVWGYDSDFLITKTFINYKDLDDWTIEEIWNFLQKNMREDKIDIHDEWYLNKGENNPNLG